MKTIKEIDPNSALFYHSYCPIVIYNSLEQCVVDANESMLDVLGYAKKELIPLNVGKLFSFENEIINQLIEHKALNQKLGRTLNNKNLELITTLDKKDGKPLKVSMRLLYFCETDQTAFIEFKVRPENVKNNFKSNIEDHKYKAILNAINCGITIVNLEGIHTYVSDQTPKMFGYKIEDMLGKATLPFFPKHQHAKLLQYSKDLIAEKERDPITYEAIHKDGHAIWIRGQAILLKDDSNKPLGILSAYVDVTDTILIEKELEKTNRFFEMIFDQSQNAIVTTNLKETQLIKINKKAEELFCLHSNNVLEEFAISLKRSLSNICGHPDHPKEAYIKKAKENGFAQFEAQHELANGEVIDVNVYFTIDYSVEDEPKGLYFITDITEKKQAYEKLDQERNLLQSVIESSKDTILVQNKDRKIIAINSAFKNEFKRNYGEELMIGGDMKAIDNSIHEKNLSMRNYWEDLNARVLNGETVTLYHKRENENKEGENHYSRLMTPLINNEKEIEGIIAISRDITALKMKETEILEKNEELQMYIDSNIQLENFAYIASHDLRQPLRSIANFIKLLQERKMDGMDLEAQTFINIIAESTDRLNSLITDLLEYSVIGTHGEKELLDVNQIFDEVQLDLKSMIEKSKAILIIPKFKEKLYAFKSDFRSLLQNLISNAIKYCKEETPPLIEIKYEIENAIWSFDIIDNGQGIDERYFKKIFGMFQRLENKERVTGTGIGLAHAKKIVDLHQGKLGVESELGKGSTFTFTIRP